MAAFKGCHKLQHTDLPTLLLRPTHAFLEMHCAVLMCCDHLVFK